MKRQSIVPILLLLLLIPITPIMAGSVSQSFHISVTIPAIAGLNAPADITTRSNESQQTAVFTLPLSPEIQIALRGQEKVLLRTFVVK